MTTQKASKIYMGEGTMTHAVLNAYEFLAH